MRASNGGPAMPLGRMEHLADLTRLHKSLKRPPQQRTASDIERIMGSTQHIAALQQNGASGFHDLCYVIQLVHLEKGESVQIKDILGGGQALFMVLSGNITVETSSPGVFASCLQSNKDVPAAEPQLELSDADLREMFDKLDEDNSGAIDATEFMHALEMLGLEVCWSEIEEAVQAVDMDGSGSLEFPEFKIVMEEKLGFGKRGPIGWQNNKNSTLESKRTYYDGEAFGDQALLEDKTLTGVITSGTHDPVVAVLTTTDFYDVLQNGFKGDLSRKLEYLKAAPLVHEILGNTELKHLAYSCELETQPAKTVLFKQGSKPKELTFLLKGQVKIMRTIEIDVDPVLASRSQSGSKRASNGVKTGKQRRPRSPPAQRILQKQVLQVSQLTGFDLISEGILSYKKHQSSYKHFCSAVAASEVLLMKLPLGMVDELLNPTDISMVSQHATMLASWWASYAETSSVIWSSQIRTQMDSSAADYAQRRIEGERVANAQAELHHMPQRTASPARHVQYGDAFAKSLLGPHPPTGTMGQWIGNGYGIPADCMETEKERDQRETAEIVFTDSIRTEMTGFLNRIRPGQRVLTAELATDPQAEVGWQDIRTNAAENMVALQEGRPCALLEPFPASTFASTPNFASLSLAGSLDASLARASTVTNAMDQSCAMREPALAKASLALAVHSTGSTEGKGRPRHLPRHHPSSISSCGKLHSTPSGSTKYARPLPSARESSAVKQHGMDNQKTVTRSTFASRMAAAGRADWKDPSLTPRPQLRASAPAAAWNIDTGPGPTANVKVLKSANSSWGRVSAPNATFPRELATGLDMALAVRPSTAGGANCGPHVNKSPSPRPMLTDHQGVLRPATAPELGSNYASPLFVARRGSETWRRAAPPATARPNRANSARPLRGRLVTAATRLLVNDMLPEAANAGSSLGNDGAPLSARATAIMQGTFRWGT